MLHWLALTILTAAAVLAGSDPAVTIRAISARSAGSWAVKAVELASGKVIVDVNAEKTLVPASNAKLFSSALALSRLGPNHRFHTRVLLNGGDLVLVGGGDPSFSVRKIPYDKDDQFDNPMAPMEELAAKIAAAGVRRIDGDVIGDDTLYEWNPYPDGWSVDDPLYEYGAPVSALTFNDSKMVLMVHRDLGVTLSPPLEHFAIQSSVTAGPKTRMFLERPTSSRDLRVWGTLSRESWTELIAVEDPALFAARALYEALTARGVEIRGSPVARHRPQGIAYQAPEGREIARRTSPPLIDLLKVINKVSQNLHAELMLRAAGGVDELTKFLGEIAVDPALYHFEDGSGLSRLTLVAPEALIKLLTHMHGKFGERWVDLLPVGGEDGTLERRFRGYSKANAVHAKTGTLSHVSALSGYAETEQFGRVVFSVIVNAHNTQSAVARQAVDDIAMTLVDGNAVSARLAAQRRRTAPVKRVTRGK